MYVFIAAGAILLLFLGFSFLSSRKHYYFILMVDFKTLNFNFSSLSASILIISFIYILI